MDDDSAVGPPLDAAAASSSGHSNHIFEGCFDHSSSECARCCHRCSCGSTWDDFGDGRFSGGAGWAESRQSERPSWIGSGTGDSDCAVGSSRSSSSTVRWWGFGQSSHWQASGTPKSFWAGEQTDQITDSPEIRGEWHSWSAGSVANWRSAGSWSKWEQSADGYAPRDRGSDWLGVSDPPEGSCRGMDWSQALQSRDASSSTTGPQPDKLSLENPSCSTSAAIEAEHGVPELKISKDLLFESKTAPVQRAENTKSRAGSSLVLLREPRLRLGQGDKLPDHFSSKSHTRTSCQSASASASLATSTAQHQHQQQQGFQDEVQAVHSNSCDFSSSRGSRSTEAVGEVPSPTKVTCSAGAGSDSGLPSGYSEQIPSSSSGANNNRNNNNHNNTHNNIINNSNNDNNNNNKNNSKAPRVLGQGPTSLVELIDTGLYGMGPSGRKPPNSQQQQQQQQQQPQQQQGFLPPSPLRGGVSDGDADPGARGRAAERSVAPSGARAVSRESGFGRGAWDKGTRASLDKAASEAAEYVARRRARSEGAALSRASPEGRSQELADGVPAAADPWASFFSSEAKLLQTPIWGDCPIRRSFDRRPAPPKVGGAELTTGHIPVLRDESLDALLSGEDGAHGFYADGTFGRGGHSTEILRRLSLSGRLWAFDVDPNAIAVGRRLEEMDERFTILHRPFADVDDALPPGVELSGMLLDIGFSSPQVDEGSRGWSCYQDGPLDLRMNFKVGLPAWKWLQTASTAEVAWVLYENGEDDDPILCSRLAEAVLERQRRCGPYTSTLQLSTCIQEVKRGLDDRRQHPAKLAFQGIRNFLNQEMQQLSDALTSQFKRLKYGGRAVVITFKPREETVVERWLRYNEDGWASPLAGKVSPERLAELFPLLQTRQAYAARRLSAPIRASHMEIERNSRSRSAMIHVLVKELRRGPLEDAGSASVGGKLLAPMLSVNADSTASLGAVDGVGDGLPLVRPPPPLLWRPLPEAALAAMGELPRSRKEAREGDAAAGFAAANDPLSLFSRGRSSGKPGDWLCGRCRDLNFSRRSTCRLCGEERPLLLDR
ncbi:unnamed protein product [Polarella glacialis]|uniref:RanBP2-type domain-containing protein n=1 Tax=Polarella glacialis TaxID=89957 RepID=A0A813HSP7_POLGL|nr:unnamed protein product [Polarella glacialis]CAE8640530.1 unnamed protein product [Polarella glacialis]